MSINSDMNQAIIDLDTAVQQRAMAIKRQAESRKELIAAMNRVNDAQKRVDALANAIEDSERHLAALSATVPPPLPPV